jgi:hypothetical protein
MDRSVSFALIANLIRINKRRILVVGSRVIVGM